MLKKYLIVSVALLVLVMTGGCGPAAEKSLSAFCAASSQAAMEPAARAFAAETGIEVLLNTGSSGQLLSQLELSQEGDLYFPASPEYLAAATDSNIVSPDTAVRINYLIPAILVQEGNPRGIKTLSDLSRPGLELAICDPQTVPAGLYAYELLEYNRVLEQVGKNIITYSENNERLSGLVILKAVDAAIAWDIAAIQQPDKLDAVYFRPDQVPRLSYMSGAVTTFSHDRESARKFLDFLVSERGRAIFKEHGYITTEAEARQFAPGARIGGEYKLPVDYQPLVQ
ncbi:MAG: molybdate ABC transporter substrate-binding protein [Chloroflexi bacterium RBG_16_56_11]|nr:MAG: molybdate ABC transporter substrate-binding protein [Chloroflexi bacterium RBG_16_56_11]